MPDVQVAPLPAWCDPLRLLGPGAWTIDGEVATATLSVHNAADLAARLRGVGLAGRPIVVQIDPALPRAAVRAARTEDARRRRATSPGFTRPGAKLDAEGKVSLTPEALALAIGRRAKGRVVIDAGCGCGGNAIGFARGGATVTAIERDAGRLAMARHNTRLYGVDVRFVHGDAVELLPSLAGDLVFVDPPWGVDWDRARVGLADVPLLSGVLAAAGGREVWAKVPPSFAVDELPEAVPEAFHGVAEGDARRVKFLLLRRRATIPP
ncbi:MAG: methyltransferase domain-containing protein [Myxococcota bacterium]